MNKYNFKFSEFNITGEPIPEDVADKILNFHIIPGQCVRESVGFPIWASEKSSFRSTKHEKKMKRSGNSEHTFKGKGATDWTCSNFQKNKDILLNALLNHTEYSRFAIYNTFIHCDYKNTNGKKQIFNSNNKSEWQFLKEI